MLTTILKKTHHLNHLMKSWVLEFTKRKQMPMLLFWGVCICLIFLYGYLFTCLAVNYKTLSLIAVFILTLKGLVLPNLLFFYRLIFITKNQIVYYVKLKKIKVKKYFSNMCLHFNIKHMQSLQINSIYMQIRKNYTNQKVLIKIFLRCVIISYITIYISEFYSLLFWIYKDNYKNNVKLQCQE